MMKASGVTAETRFNENIFRLVSYLLVAAMMASGTLTVVSLLERLMPGWQPWYLPVICFVVSLDSLYSYRSFKAMSLFSSEWSSAAVTQMVVALILIRLAVGFSHGAGAFWGELTGGWFEFLLSFFSVEYLVILSLVAVTWAFSLSFAGLLDELGLDTALAQQDAEGIPPENPRPPRHRLLNLIFSTGAGLVVFTALLRLDFRSLSAGKFQDSMLQVPALSNGGASTLAYFMLALVLLSLSQFVSLNTRWSLERVPVSREMAGRWAFYSLIFLLLLASLASLLPTSYSLGPLAALGYLFDIIRFVVFWALQILISAFLFLFSLPFLFLGKSSPASAGNRIIPPQPPALPDSAAAGATGPWLRVFQSVLFWSVFWGILAFALVQYLRQRHDLWAALRKAPAANWLHLVWDWLRGLFGAARNGIAGGIAAGLERLRPRRMVLPEAGGWIHLRRLDPRRRVFFFYQAFLRRSSESGFPRSPSQTPQEFAARLDPSLPDAEPDIDALTAAFIDARYTPQPVQPEQASLARQTWERLRKALRKIDR